MSDDRPQMQMPMYQSIKRVWALKILNAPTAPYGDFESIEVEPPFLPLRMARFWLERHKPQAGGYVVGYMDGYMSYSPADAFEAGHVSTRLPIEIRKSPTADTRTCDYANVSRETLLASSQEHIADVRKAITYFISKLITAASNHDADKLYDLDGFHRDFTTGFKQTDWWDRHRKINRHHLLQADGVPDDVNLIDVLDMIADCVMAGMARSGDVYALDVSNDVLRRAFVNTVEQLKARVVVAADS